MTLWCSASSIILASDDECVRYMRMIGRPVTKPSRGVAAVTSMLMTLK